MIFKVHRLTLFLTFLFFTPIFSQNQDGTSNDSCDFFSSNPINGSWKNPNGCGITNIYSLDSIELSLVSMQIRVLVRGVPDENDCMKLNLYLVQPTDLGGGGMMLSWDNFSLSIPIGELEFINTCKMKNTWLGFYDTQADSTISEFAYDWNCADTLFKDSSKKKNTK